jgi:hypothetical protein
MREFDVDMVTFLEADRPPLRAQPVRRARRRGFNHADRALSAVERRGDRSFTAIRPDGRPQRRGPTASRGSVFGAPTPRSGQAVDDLGNRGTDAMRSLAMMVPVVWVNWGLGMVLLVVLAAGATLLVGRLRARRA